MKEVLFVCVRNSGRSQMAEAFFNRLAEERGLDVRAGSAGTQPAERVNATVRQAMIEIGIDTSMLKPKLLTEEMVERAEIVVTMGCAVGANACPGIGRKDVTDWGMPDPEGMSEDQVRVLRDAIRSRVVALLESLTAGQPTGR